MKIIIGADFAGFDLKEEIKSYLEEEKHQIIDVGMYDLDNDIPYYEVAAIAAKKIQNGEAEKAILLCGTGMGVAIMANKFKGVYASVVESEFAGQHARVINDTNVLTMGGFIVTPYRAKKIIDLWLNSKHTEGYEHIGDFLCSAVEEIGKIEAENMS